MQASEAGLVGERVENMVVKGGEVLLPSGEMRRCDVAVQDGAIRQVGADLTADLEIDAAGAWVLPGLIDLHTHGVERQSVLGGSLRDYAAAEAAHGATAFCPTFFGPPEETAEHLRRYRCETDELRSVPQAIGFRLESPYLAGTGGGRSRDLAKIDPALTQALLEAGGGLIRIWDISPELPGAPELIRRLSGERIVCSIAHTDATVEQARQAVDAGARLVTHLFDTFRLPEEKDPGVYPAGLIDYLLVEDRVVCETITDGTHVHPLLVEEALRCKSPERICVVTDSNYGAGLPPGRYELPGQGEPILIQGPNEGARLAERGMLLAGSALTPIDALRNLVGLFSQDIASACRMCSTTPARLMGLNKGEIAVGRDADLIIVEPAPSHDLISTISRGSVIHGRL